MNAAARARLAGWKLSLLDLSTSNRLLDVRDERTCFALPGIDPVRIAAAFASGSSFGFETGMESSFDTGRLRVPLGATELERRLIGMRRAARDQLAHGGVHALWLALGLLHWCEADGTTHAAPLWLVPVELDRTLRLAAAETVAPTFNHVLGEKLRRDFDILFDGGTELPLALAAAEGIAVTRPGWRVERGVRIGVFSFAQLAIWKDLEARSDDELLASPVIAHLADGGPAAFAQPSSTAAALVTRARPPLPELVAPLDADASQLVAVAAAGEGASFVVQGAPGTGKSQTIANLIVNAVAHGKTVLFASNKVSALQAVRERLATLGLGEFCLDLCSHPGRGDVAQQLARVLERAFRPGSGPSGDDRRIAELRDALDAHVAAMHRVGPFGRSLHDVLGRLVELKTTPRAALAERDATGLDGGTYLRRLFAIELLAETAKAVEPVAAHPWQRSTLMRWPQDGETRVLSALEEAGAAGAALAVAVRDVAALIPNLVARTRQQLAALGTLCGLAATSPRPGAELLTHLRTAREDELGEQIALIRARGTGSVETPRDPLTYLALAHRHRALALEVDDRFTERVGELDAHGMWSQLRKWTQSMAPVRFVALRSARAAVREVALPLALETDDSMITALEAVMAERACRKALLAAAEPAKRWFGELHTDDIEKLDLSRIDAAVKWAAALRKAFDATDVIGGEPGRTTAWRALVAQVAATPDAGALTTNVFARLAEGVVRWAPAIEALADVTGIDHTAIGAGDDHLAALREQIETLRHSIGAFPAWVAFHAARRGALEAGVGPAVGAIERGDLVAAELSAAWERATLLAWSEAELADTAALATFHGSAHHAHVAAFADLDRAMLALVRSRALARLAERVPKPPRRGAIDEGGELGTLLQAAKKPDTVPSLRALFAQLPTLLPRLAPCMVMTPVAIAEHLDPALPPFDIVVFDESSQLAVSEALGALVRAKSAVVVGDSQQLRPASELPSLLDVCVGSRLPELRLGWHYRSKHEDLIAFANERYYDDRLQVFPTAFSLPDFGISWRKLEGVFDSDAGINRTEAESLVADVVARLRDPQQRTRSIGIVTFTRAQQALIEDLLDEARAADPSIDIAFAEPLIVRHVDAMQGEERDVILVSFGFGPSLDGPDGLAQLTARQVCVAITCAREQLVLLSSWAPEDLDAANPLARDLADLIVFARAGGGAARSTEDAKPASPITAAIGRALGERGWVVRHQVGCGAFKIDLAVVDPNDPDRYVLAIEHDGTAYASANAARDRDRLRAQVLAQLGWRLHRIWSLDWWLEPEREIQRAHGAIVTAVAASRQRRAQPPSASPAAPGMTAPLRRIARASRPPASSPLTATGSAPVVRIPPIAIPAPMALDATTRGGSTAETSTGATESSPITPSPSGTSGGAPTIGAHGDTVPQLAAGSAPIRLARGAIPIGPYTVAAIPAGRRAPDDMFAPRYLPELGKVVEQVLAAEAPMHVDLLARRVGGYFGIGRVTQRVTDQVRIALAGRGRWGDEDNVVWRMDQDPAGVPPVRVAGSGPAALRDIELVPLSELAAAARIVVERAPNIQSNDLVRDAARLLGFARITERVTDRIVLGVQLALQRTLITLDNGRARLPD